MKSIIDYLASVYFEVFTLKCLRLVDRKTIIHMAWFRFALNWADKILKVDVI